MELMRQTVLSAGKHALKAQNQNTMSFISPSEGISCYTVEVRNRVQSAIGVSFSSIVSSSHCGFTAA
jgi:hypothetical protein